MPKRINRSESLLEYEESDDSFQRHDDDTCNNWPEDAKCDEIDELCARLASSSLKNFAYKFENKGIEETSLYLEVLGGKKRIVVKKTSVCWLFRKEYHKLSSDRKLRVMASVNVNKRKKTLKKRAKKVHRFKR